jgi:hypothetical protein
MLRHSLHVILGEVDRQSAPRRPIDAGSLRFDEPDCCDAVSAGQFCVESSDCVSSCGVEQFVTGDSFLRSKLLANQFARDSQRGSA